MILHIIYVIFILLGGKRKDCHSCIMYRINTYLILRFFYTIYWYIILLKYQNISKVSEYWSTVSSIFRSPYCSIVTYAVVKKENSRWNFDKTLRGISHWKILEWSYSHLEQSLRSCCWSDVILSSSELAWLSTVSLREVASLTLDRSRAVSEWTWNRGALARVPRITLAARNKSLKQCNGKAILWSVLGRINKASNFASSRLSLNSLLYLLYKNYEKYNTETFDIPY